MAKFKIGDRVRWTRCDNKYQNAEVTENDTSMFDYRIAEDHDYTYAYEHELAAVTQQPQLTIQAGHYYKTRDGRKVGPMEEEDCGDGYPWTAENGGYYDDSGKRQSGYTPADLIAEWVDEPAVAEPKFKVGDRVHYKDEFCEGIGTITEPNGDDDWFVEVEERDREWAPFDGATTRVFDSVDLRLVAPATSGKEDAEPDSKLLVSISADTSALDAEIDRVLKRLRKLKRRARKLGISLEYSQLRDAT